MKTKATLFMVVPAMAMMLQSCAVIRPGEIGIKQRLGVIVGVPI